MGVDALEEVKALLVSALETGGAQVFKDDRDSNVYFAWIGGDTFKVELIQDNAFVVHHQIVSWVVIRGTRYWRVFESAAERAQEDDGIGFAATRAVIAALCARMRNARKV